MELNIRRRERTKNGQAMCLLEDLFPDLIREKMLNMVIKVMIRQANMIHDRLVRELNRPYANNYLKFAAPSLVLSITPHDLFRFLGVTMSQLTTILQEFHYRWHSPRYAPHVSDAYEVLKADFKRQLLKFKRE